MLNIIKDDVNPNHFHVYLNKFEVGAIHCPWEHLKQIYLVYTTDERTKLLTFNTFDECFKYIQEYVNG